MMTDLQPERGVGSKEELAWCEREEAGSSKGRVHYWPMGDGHPTHLRSK